MGIKLQHLLFLLFFALSADKSEGISSRSLRKKRYLIFPRNGSKVQLIIGVGLPVPLEEQAVTVGFVIKAPFLVPDNASYLFDPYVTFQKRSTQRLVSRYDIYKMFEAAISRNGRDGKGCLLRSICEAAHTPYLAEGTPGKLLHLFLTPSSTDESPRTVEEKEFYSAELLGRKEDINCQLMFPECRYDVFELISRTDLFSF